MNSFNVPAHIRPETAKLPQAYEGAKTALAHCVEIDECKDWADKAQALASYAKQANDDQLMKMATRIRDRAIRRAGELLKQIEPATGSHWESKREGTRPLTRSDAATEAGLSSHQAKQALRVANVPADEFERQVESDKPPTVSQLAQQGIKRPASAPRQPVSLDGRDPAAFNRALHFIAEIEDYAKAIGKVDLSTILPVLTSEERARVRSAIARVDAIHDHIATRI
jgi:hypothetical protein